MLTSSHGVK